METAQEVGQLRSKLLSVNTAQRSEQEDLRQLYLWDRGLRPGRHTAHIRVHVKEATVRDGITAKQPDDVEREPAANLGLDRRPQPFVRSQGEGQNSTVSLDLQTYLDQRCSDLRDEYSPIVASMLAAFQERGLWAEELKHLSHNFSAVLYIHEGSVFIDGDGREARHRMIDHFGEYIAELSAQVALPDLVLPLNAEDFPVSRREPWFGFCRQRLAHNDILLPNTVEEGLLPKEDFEHEPSRAGPGDTRQAKAGLDHPDTVDTGLTDWDGLEWQLDPWDTFNDWAKPYLPLKEWADQYRYVINVAGNCASARLSKQLLSDAAVFLVGGEDEEWYYGLLRPYVHYIPVSMDGDGTLDIVQQLRWAEAHPEEVARIVAASTDFARRRLLPGSGRDCYTLQLLHDFRRLVNDPWALVPGSNAIPYTSRNVPIKDTLLELED